MNTQRFDWTDARVASLKELHKQGLPASAIAQQFGISRNAVIGKIHRVLDIAPIPPSVANSTHKTGTAWTEEMIETAVKAWADDKSPAVIGAMIGKTKGQINSYASDHRHLFPHRSRGRKASTAPAKKPVEQAFIAPQFLVPPAGYDAERMKHGKTLEERGQGECCYPLGNGSPFIYCCAETDPGKSYCWHHAKRMHQPKGSGVSA